MVTGACLWRPPQVVEDGYEFFAKRQLVTLFSAPNYCGEFDNAGGMMSVDETLMCSFQVRQNNSLSQNASVTSAERLAALLDLIACCKPAGGSTKGERMQSCDVDVSFILGLLTVRMVDSNI